MFKKTLFAAVLIALPSLASAVTVTAENDYATALGLVDPTQSLDLPGAWVQTPLTIDPDASVGGQYRSPFETAGTAVPGIAASAGYFTVGVTSTPYSGFPNPAELTLSSLAKSVSLLWGSPDTYNTLELYNGGTLVGTVLGGQFNALGKEASFVTISANDVTEYFDTLKFASTTNAFEFSNVSIAPVPLPAGLPLLLAGLGTFAWMRRRKAA
ncbi:VPLPA-CTERM sorting domain-containing protein [Roseobacter litoralis]|uniref:Npun_F0296 family exosortase-dependent surface protein n=1 Tax=Roseobacter litoralis TaxID=42443 RepID=UPI002493D0BD|nr:VPLPA-CTERM sorting domain-containing protein [Roseobacter litoralis]